MSLSHTVLNLAAEGAIVAAGVNLFVLHECTFGYQLAKSFIAKEMIVHAVNFSGTWFAVGGRHRELDIQVATVHYVADNR